MELELQFDEGFFQDETICGFHVTAKQKKVWACEIDLAQKLISVCKKHDIQIMAFAGTLLGAVRHQGFIPWDDDMDFCMLRPEYEKLLKVAPEEFREPYFFQTALTDRASFCGYARLRNSTTTGAITGDPEDYNCGIYIDIFVMDGYTDNKALYHQQVKRLYFLNVLLAMTNKSLSSENPVKNIAIKLAGRIVRINPIYHALFRRYQKVLSKYTGKTDKVTMMTHNPTLREHYWVQVSCFDKTIELPYHNIMVPAPADYDSLLQNIYGNYMEFPPAEERGEWHNGIITFEPDIPYKEYFRRLKDSKQQA